MGIIPKPKKNLDSLTRLNREKEVKRLRHEEEELVDQLGQESDRKALPTVKEYSKEIDQEEKLQQNLDFEILKKLSNSKISYQRYLLVILNRFIKEEDIPRRYRLYAESNDQGIVLGIEETDFVKAFKVCGIPLYDVHACKVLATELGNTVSRLEGNVRMGDGGVALANQEELKIILKGKYGRRRSS